MIIVKQVDLSWKIVAIDINATDFTANITIAKGYMDGAEFKVLETRNLPIATADVLTVLGVIKDPGKTILENVVADLYGLVSAALKAG